MFNIIKICSLSQEVVQVRQGSNPGGYLTEIGRDLRKIFWKKFRKAAETSF